jgi:hypothetical protein
MLRTVPVATKKGRPIIPPGHYDLATGITVTWNVTATKFFLETEKEAIVFQNA